MTSVRLGVAAVVAATLVVTGCSKPDQPANVAAPSLETLQVSAADGMSAMDWDGVVQAVEQATLAAQTSGRVSELMVDVDSRVARAAPLLRLTSTDQRAALEAANAGLRAAEAQLVDAAARFKRASELVGRELISRDDFDRVKAVNDAAMAARDAATAQVAQAGQQLGYTEVRAPYAAIVATRHVELGETVVPGQPLVTLYSPGELRVEVQVPQSQAEQIRREPAATIVLPDGREVFATKVIVYPSADPQAHSNRVRVLLPSLAVPPRPGQTVKTRFAGAPGPAGIWVPAGVVVQRGELSACYVVDDAGIVLRQLRLGRQSGTRVEVLAGLMPGERVAVDPVAALEAMRERQAASEARE